jgi:hypothetical protein
VEEYLSKKSKLKYQIAFEELLSYNDSDFWDLDEGLQEILIGINKNENIQTLYSKKCSNFNQFGADHISYLQLAYSKNVEFLLYNALENIQTIMKTRGLKSTILKEGPADNPNGGPNSEITLACSKDPDYFRINSFTIEIEGGNFSDHVEFFQLLNQKLQSVASKL